MDFLVLNECKIVNNKQCKDNFRHFLKYRQLNLPHLNLGTLQNTTAHLGHLQFNAN
jgi:hypothetical protein